MSKNLPITTYGMQVLRNIAEPVTNLNTNIIELVENMFFTMKNADGIGLAAPQVNSTTRIILIDISPIDKYKDFKPVVMINPEIIDKYGESDIDEGCLSIPEVRAKILRPEKVHIRYFDLNFKEYNIEADGMFARVTQHEIDHLNGILFTDYLSKEELKKVKKQLTNIAKGNVSTDYPLFLNEV